MNKIFYKPLLKLNKICAVVTGKTVDDFLKQLQYAQEITDFVELRIDYIDHIKPTDLKYMAYYTHKPSILCCRSIRDGGNFKGTSKDQNEILQAGNDLKFNYIDIDLAIAPLIKINNKKSKTIISYHNFEKTPSLGMLETIAKEMYEFNPDILKFATTAKNENDAKILLKFLLNKKEDENRIVVGMGKHGQVIRLLGPLLGSFLTFASLGEAQSAPGQIDAQAMQQVYQSILHLLDTPP